jgi:hypothetical protein
MIHQDARKRWDRQSRAFYNVFRQPDRVEKLAQIIERLVSTIYIATFLYFCGLLVPLNNELNGLIFCYILFLIGAR